MKEITMLTLHDHIQELRAELHGCIMTRSERIRIKQELADALAEQEALERSCDDVFEIEERR
jgi:hypothetical protein